MTYDARSRRQPGWLRVAGALVAAFGLARMVVAIARSQMSKRQRSRAPGASV